MKFLKRFLSFLIYVLPLGMIGFLVFYLIDVHHNPEKYSGFTVNPFGTYTTLFFVEAAAIIVWIALLIVRAVVVGKMRRDGISEFSKKEIARGLLWKARKRNKLGLPWTTTVYSLDQERLYIRKGIFNTMEAEVRLYRIIDMTVHRKFRQKIFGIGTIHCDSSDQTMKNFDIINIRSVDNVKRMLSTLVDESRIRNKVFTSELSKADQQHDPEMMDHDHPGSLPEIDLTDLNGNGIPDTFEH